MRFSLLGAALPLLVTAITARLVNLPTLDNDGLPVLEIVTKGAPPPVDVPKLEELTATTFLPKISKGYWFVKHYSPRCPHCRAMAPYFDGLHSIYTKAGIEASHNFHFAAVNCDVYGDICENEEYKIMGYPTLNLYKDGKLLEAFDPSKRRDIPTMSDWVEEKLEKIVPTTTTPKEQEKGKDKDKEGGKEKAAVPTPTPAPVVVRNPDGISRDFDRATFVDVVQSTRDPWLIKFYAPWCHHCQAMAPSWDSLAHQMKGKLNIGEVNCDAEPRICKALHVDSYPTILFLSGGESVVYNGLRGIGDLVSYANKAAQAGLRELDAGMLEDVDGKEEVYFIYFYNEATTSEDFAAIERVTLPLIGRAPLYKTASEAIAQKYRVQTFPRLLVVRDGVPTYFPHTAPKDMRDHKKIGDWMKTVWLPMVPELTAANSHEIMNGHLVVLAILSRGREKEFLAARKELKEAAAMYIEQRAQAEKAERQELRDKKELRIEEAEDRGDDKALREANSMQLRTRKPKKEVGFAWVDGVFWERWVRSVYGVEIERDGERVVVNEEDRKLVWEFDAKGERIQIKRSEMLEVVGLILQGSAGGLKPRSTRQGWEGYVPSLGGWMGWAVVFVGVGAVGLWLRGKRRVGGGGSQGGWLGLDGGEKGWLGGGAGNGPPGKYD